MSISGNATWLFGLFRISCLFIAPFENVMGFFTLKTQIEFSPRVPPEPLCVPLGVRVPQFGNRCYRGPAYNLERVDRSEVIKEIYSLYVCVDPSDECIQIITQYVV